MLVPCSLLASVQHSEEKQGQNDRREYINKIVKEEEASVVAGENKEEEEKGAGESLYTISTTP